MRNIHSLIDQQIQQIYDEVANGPAIKVQEFVEFTPAERQLKELFGIYIPLNKKVQPIQSKTVLDFLGKLNDLEAFLERDAVEIVLDGPTETVKTFNCLLFLYILHHLVPNLQSIILRSEKTTTYTTVLKTLVQHILPYGLNKHAESPIHPYGGTNKPEWLDFKNGGRLHIGGEDDKDGKVLGTEWDIALYSQCEQSKPEFWQRLSGRCTGRQGSLKANEEEFGILLGECNPDHSLHHIKKREQRGQIEMISLKHKDNIKIFKDGSYTNYGARTIRGLKKRYSGQVYKRLYEGKWVAAEGIVYKFDQENHMKDIRWGDIPSDYEIITGRDYGTTVNSPFVHLAFAYSPNHDRILELPNSQIYQSGKEVAEIGLWIQEIEEQIKQQLGKEVAVRVADHDSQAQLILQNLGLPAILANKELLIGIEQVKNRLKNGEIHFTPHSLWNDPDPELVDKPQQLFDEWPLYKYKDEAAQLKNIAKADVPVKGNDHGLDVVRYICMYLAPQEINLGGPIRSKSKSKQAKSMLPSYLR